MITHKKTSVFFSVLLIIFVVLYLKQSIALGYIFLLLTLWLLTIVWGSFNIGSNYHLKAHCHNSATTEKKIALTFDDGPTEFTPQFLEVLERYQAPATFFCIGNRIEKNPGIIRQIVAKGHTIGNHSYSHSPFFDFYNTPKISAELQKTDDLILKHTGKKPILFRPPYGVTTPSIAKALKKSGHHVIGWNMRSLDGILTDKDKILKRLQKQITPGGIVLLHDTSSHSYWVLEQFLNYLQQNNYTVVGLEELLNLNAYEN